MNNLTYKKVIKGGEEKVPVLAIINTLQEFVETKISSTDTTLFGS